MCCIVGVEDGCLNHFASLHGLYDFTIRCVVDQPEFVATPDHLKTGKFLAQVLRRGLVLVKRTLEM
jgi:hypothetical protein